MKPLRTFTPVRAARKPSARRAAPVARPAAIPRTSVSFAFGDTVPLNGARAATDGPLDSALAFALGTPSTGAQFTRGAAPITERQVEIMTATLCEAVLNIGERAVDDAPAAIDKLVAAMVKQVRRLNEAVGQAREPSCADLGARVRLTVTGQRRAELEGSDPSR
ncbi:hypothetical protein [Burkholderia glumae]|uniref:hypothetical protein n=1 Tax=Burkholderia glumae TaxID=337 RepID=UPI0020CDC916|nr:hypothetical protein [Burkholderia glumae]MCQ0032552.1 hypothetical protein [Burkholderia glumae]MCQ0035810.1 hypothetical protein [Burkholderia glumae]